MNFVNPNPLWIALIWGCFTLLYIVGALAVLVRIIYITIWSYRAGSKYLKILKACTIWGYRAGSKYLKIWKAAFGLIDPAGVEPAPVAAAAAGDDAAGGLKPITELVIPLLPPIVVNFMAQHPVAAEIFVILVIYVMGLIFAEVMYKIGEFDEVFAPKGCYLLMFKRTLVWLFLCK